MKLCPDFKIIIYHGDYKEQPNSIEALTKDHALFNGQEQNAWTIVLTTFGICAQRYGPTPQAYWRLDKKRMSQEERTMLFWKADETWPQNLSDLFHYRIIDEAQSIKNPMSHAHTAIPWFKPDFNILVTGTPDIHNVATDCEGYMDLLESPAEVIERTVEVDRLEEWGNTAHINVYDNVDDNHPAAQALRPTLRAYKKWITDKDAAPNATVQGIRIAACLQACMVRRSMVSNLDGKEIGFDVPMCKRRRAVCAFTEDEKKLYDDFSANPKRKLIRVDHQTGMITWNWAAARVLILLTTWLGLHRIHHIFSADKISGLLKKENLLAWITGQYCSFNPTEAFPQDSVTGQIALVLEGAPKLRAMLATV